MKCFASLKTICTLPNKRRFFRSFAHRNCNCCGSPLCSKLDNKDNLQNIFTTTNDLSSFIDSNPSNPHLISILANNKKWIETTKKNDPNYFENLAKIHNPKYLYFGCSDSRVPVSQVLGLSRGEVFVHRNFGNLVPGNDLNALAVLEYAITHVGITDIIVTGHYDCEAIRAAMSRQDLGLLENWLRQIRDVYRIHKDYLDLLSVYPCKMRQ